MDQRICVQVEHRTGQNDASNVGVLVEGTTSLNNFSQQLIAKSVQRLGAVQGDQTDLATSFGQDVLVRLTSAHVQATRADDGGAEGVEHG